MRAEAQRTGAGNADQARGPSLVGNHSSMQQVFHLIERVAPSRAPVLITGESGTLMEKLKRRGWNSADLIQAA